MNLSQVQGGGDADIEMSVAAPAANTGTASPQSRNTRSQVDPLVQNTVFQVQSPIMVAENHIISHTLSLHEGLATLLLDKGKKILALKHKLFLKERFFFRMEDDAAYVPVAVRAKFKLQAWKEAEASPEFATLATQTADIITTLQLQLKNQIIQNIRLDQTVLTAQLNNLFVEALAAATSLHLTALGKISNNTHIVALAILAQYERTLLKHFGMTAAQVTALYRTVNTVPADVLTTSELARQRATSAVPLNRYSPHHGTTI
jgi:hypothetical protein